MPPWLLLAIIVSLTLSLVYQIATGRHGWRVILYWTVILAGVLGAEALAESLGWNLTRLGDLRMLPDALGATVVMTVLWVFGI